MVNNTTQWEYKVATLGGALSKMKDEEMEALLNDWGEEGWEVIAVTQLENSVKIRVTAKRPLSDTTRRQRAWPA